MGSLDGSGGHTVRRLNAPMTQMRGPRTLSGREVSTVVAEPQVIGRESECVVVQRVLSQGEPRRIEICGVAGIGKTTVLNAVLANPALAGTKVLRAQPVQTETSFSFAHLGDLIGDAVGDVIDDLVPRQRDALQAALLWSDPQGLGAPDQRAVAAATLECLRRLSVNASILLAIDDVQWLDPSTANVLGYALRRMGSADVRVIATRRLVSSAPAPLDDSAEPFRMIRVERIDLDPLTATQLGQLVRARTELQLSRSRANELHAGSEGNPLFALEIARLVALDGLPEAGQPLPVPADFERLVHDRLASISPPARTLLVALSLATTLTPELVDKIRASLDIEADAWSEALDADVVVAAPGIAFAHPMFRTVISASTESSVVAEIHRTLAGIVANPEERARHLALSAVEPDATAADIVSEASTAARARGAPEAAAQLARLAIDLTPTFLPEVRHTRLLDLADHLFASGDTPAATVLLESWRSDAPRGPIRAQVCLALGQLHHKGESFAKAGEAHSDGLLEPGLPAGLASDLHRELAYAQMFQGDMPSAREHSRLGTYFGTRDGSPTRVLSDSVLTAAIQFIGGGGLSEQDRSRLAASPVADHLETIRHPRFMAALADSLSGDFTSARTAFAAMSADAISTGDEGSVPMLLSQLAIAEFGLGAIVDSEAHLTDALVSAEEMGQTVREALVKSLLGRILSLRGEFDQADALGQRGLELATAAGSLTGMMDAYAVLGWLASCRDDVVVAADTYEPLSMLLLSRGELDPGIARWVPDGAEALARAGRYEAASKLLDPYQTAAERLERDGARAASLRARAVIAQTQGEREVALALLAEARDLHEHTAEAFETARTQLAQGTVLRRTRAKRSARDALETARAGFENVGATWWRARADEELEGIGARTESAGDLSPTEDRVARLASDGQSNKEIAAALLMSPKTVESHLSRVYRKLEVRGRTELAARMGQERVHE
jgi:DNA-binding CsgD family transcriptional regulator